MIFENMQVSGGFCIREEPVGLFSACLEVVSEMHRGRLFGLQMAISKQALSGFKIKWEGKANIFYFAILRGCFRAGVARN